MPALSSLNGRLTERRSQDSVSPVMVCISGAKAAAPFGRYSVEVTAKQSISNQEANNRETDKML